MSAAALALAAGCQGVNEDPSAPARDNPASPGSTASVSAPASDPRVAATGLAPPAPAAPVVPAPDSAMPDPTFAGHWYLDRAGERRVLTVASSGMGLVAGTFGVDAVGAAATPIDHVTFEPTGELRFRANDAGGGTWYELRMTDGVARGRFATPKVGSLSDQAPTDATAYDGRVTGWRAETFDAALVPRTFSLSIGGRAATLRLDQSDDPSADGAGFEGHLRIYTDADGALAEQPEEDLSIDAWDGQTLSFTRTVAANAPRFSGVVSGRTLSGTWQDGAGNKGAWTGTRAEVLGHGLATRAADDVRRWQTATRRRLRALVMDGGARPTTVTVTELSTGASPFPQGALLANRDDAEALWPQAYTVSELSFEATLPDRYGAAPLTRTLHGMMSVPTTPAPAGGYPVVVAINGHWGSAKRLFNPNDPIYWYGEAFARRGNVVISVDVGHRPLDERSDFYLGIPDGDDAEGGNAPHPSIHAAGLTSDWEEDGERTWDVMRALDHVLRRSDVNPARVSVVGLSMGAEVADWMGALDTRVAVTIPSGDPPDWYQMYVAGNHQCWRWQAGDEREYLAPSDLYALIAGRTLIRETGMKDETYSYASPPFATAKQAVRDAHAAFDVLGSKLVHYLHWDAHAFHIGDALPDAAPDGVTAMVEVAPTAAAPWLIDWQTDATMTLAAPTIFDLLPGELTAPGRPSPTNTGGNRRR